MEPVKQCGRTFPGVAVMTMGMLVAAPAHAYVGPGLGLTAIGTVLAVIAAIFLAAVGFIWYPLRRLLRNRKASAAKGEDATAEKPGH